jgi:hypothetical protein
MGTELGTTNIWLAILTLAVVVQTAMMVTAAVVALRFARRADAVLTRAERSIVPLAASLSTALDDIHGLTETARRAGDSVRATADQLGNGVSHVRGLLVGELWPALGAFRAAKAAISAFGRRRKTRKLTLADRIAEANFVSEGAPVHGSR